MFKTITNPYIVGNPIKTKKMFYGRKDDFEFIRRKLESGSKSYIIVLSGERRSGKTSILFQILNGQLGENFIPILIDMQTMAGLKNEGEFFEKFAQETLKYIDDRFSLSNYNFHSTTDSPYKVFSKLLDDIHEAYPDKNKLILVDEYELIETKSKEGSLSPNFVPYLSGLLESEKHISFIFTGSRTLEERGNDYWQNLFGKSLFRNVSFLSEQDTMRLITQPVEGQITFDKEVLNAIYRLTSGQPFYTQIVGQNIVDFVNEAEKTNIEIEDLNRIVNEILENPLPQMIYFWNSLPQSQMLMLSLLADMLDTPEKKINAAEIIKQTKKKKLGISLDSHLVNTILEGLYHQSHVTKTDNGYSFQIDLIRQWIKRDHSIWRVMKEVDIESIIQTERSSSVTYEDDSKIEVIRGKIKWLIPVSLAVVAVIILTWWIIFGSGSSEPINEQTLVENNTATDPDENPIEKTNPPQKATDQNQSGTTKPESDIKVPEKKRSDRSEVKSSNIKNANPAPTKNQSNPINQITPYKKAMLDSKNQAMLANAAELASGTFNKGIMAEKAAENYITQKQYQPATKKYEEAQKHFVDASVRSKNAQEGAKEQLNGIILQLQNIQKDLKPQHHSMNEYRDAENLRKKGEQYNDQGKYLFAYHSYSEAVSLYQKTVQIRITQTEKIHGAIEGYAHALENKSIEGSGYIHDSYETELQEEWQPFFKLAEDITIGMDIHDIEFDNNKASVFVDVVMKYSGAGGSGEKNRWKFELTESGTVWLISKISKAN
jgi:AAA+ ATPase superfamily predicted ATPase